MWNSPFSCPVNEQQSCTWPSGYPLKVICGVTMTNDPVKKNTQLQESCCPGQCLSVSQHALLEYLSPSTSVSL